MLSNFAVLTSLVSIVFASPFMPHGMRLHEKRDAPPHGFVSNGVAPPNQSLSLRLSLVQTDPKGLEDMLYAVSTPDSASYGQFLSQSEVCLHRSSFNY